MTDFLAPYQGGTSAGEGLDEIANQTSTDTAANAPPARQHWLFARTFREARDMRFENPC